MNAFWIEFTQRPAACIEVNGSSPEDAKVAAGAFGTVRSVETLPYPCEPRIGEKSDCPSLCLGKRECRGKTACPQRYSCSE